MAEPGPGTKAADGPELRLETPRLVLRDWRRGDIDAFARVTNTPAVMRWLGGVLPDERLADLEARVIERQTTLGHTFWLVERKADGGHLAGEVLGFCGLKRIDAPGRRMKRSTWFGSGSSAFSNWPSQLFGHLVFLAVLAFFGFIHGLQLEFAASPMVALGYFLIAAICFLFAWREQPEAGSLGREGADLDLEGSHPPREGLAGCLERGVGLARRGGQGGGGPPSRSGRRCRRGPRGWSRR